MEAAGPYIQTVSGKRVNPLDMAPADVDIEDIAVALGNQCRFGGHTRRFYSVAQHATLASHLVEEDGRDTDACLWALLHDASEAYLVDLPHPLKHRSELGRLFAEAEAPLQRIILERFRLAPTPPDGIKAIDRRLLATERRLLSGESWHWPELDNVEPMELEITPLSPSDAASLFLARYDGLVSRRASHESGADAVPTTRSSSI